MKPVRVKSARAAVAEAVAVTAAVAAAAAAGAGVAVAVANTPDNCLLRSCERQGVKARYSKGPRAFSLCLSSCLYFNFKKFFKICRPFWVKMLSGWNCTPQIGSCLCLTPMISPSSVSAVISRQSGSVSR